MDLLGYDTDPYNPHAMYRDLLQFDLSPLPPHVTLLSTTIRSAMWTRDYSPTGRTVNASLYPLTAAWTASATWQTRDGTTPWTTPGGDYDPGSGASTGLDFSSSGASNGAVSADDVSAVWNITPIVRR